MTEGDEVKADPALVERVRTRLETDGTVIRGTDKNKRPEAIHRAAQLAVEELTVDAHPITWTTARTRPRATAGIDDPRDVLIGRLAVLLGAADGGHHAASYDTLTSAAVRLRSRSSTERAIGKCEQGSPRSVETQRLVNDEITARLARLDSNTSRLDTKATTLLGFVLATSTFFATQNIPGFWKIVPYIAFAVCAFFGIQAMRVRPFRDAPEPAVLIEHISDRSEIGALVVINAAKTNVFNANRKIHERKALYWQRAMVCLTIAVLLTVLALILGGRDARTGQQSGTGFQASTSEPAGPGPASSNR